MWGPKSRGSKSRGYGEENAALGSVDDEAAAVEKQRLIGTRILHFANMVTILKVAFFVVAFRSLVSLTLSPSADGRVLEHSFLRSRDWNHVTNITTVKEWKRNRRAT